MHEAEHSAHAQPDVRDESDFHANATSRPQIVQLDACRRRSTTNQSRGLPATHFYFRFQSDPADNVDRGRGRETNSARRYDYKSWQITANYSG